MRLSEMPKNETKNSKPNDAKQKDINQKYEELKDCSPDDLMGRLAKEIQSQKNNGTFDYEGLKKSIEQIKIYMPAQTYENMIRIIENLK